MYDFNAPTPYDDCDAETLKSQCLSCEKCALHETRNQVVFGSGPIPCNIMAIGEGPGEQEDLQGEPFVGKAGKLLSKIFEAVNIKRPDDIYIANTVKCRPPNNRTPHPHEIEACNDWLRRQIHLVQPRILLLLGSPSLKTFLGSDLSITKVRGQWFQAQVPYMDDPLYVMPLFHPSYLLRHASKEKGKPKWLTWTDMQEVKAALDFCLASTA